MARTQTQQNLIASLRQILTDAENGEISFALDGLHALSDQADEIQGAHEKDQGSNDN